jgi:hypothetical protein
MSRILLILCLFTGLCFFPHELSSQETAVPDALRRPERGEAPRYAYDFVIGELGQGEASDGAYLFARNLLSAITTGRSDAPVLENSALPESLFQEVRGIRPRSFRLGGGRNEADGSVSFVTRFIGQDESITGELFIRFEDGSWILDDLFLEEKRAISEIRDGYRYNFSPYERFY